MKKTGLFSVAAFAGILLLLSCSQNDTNPSVSESEMASTVAYVNDKTTYDQNTDESLDDINAQTSSSANARLEGNGPEFTKRGRGFRLAYGGGLFHEAKKQGFIDVDLRAVDSSFFEAGAVYTVTYDSVKVNRKNKAMTIIGTQTITNVTGGNPRDIAVNDSVVFIIRATMSITFDTSGIRTWQTAKKYVWSNIDGNIIYTIKADTTIDGYANTETWGTNRFGSKFYSQILSPITVKSTCGFRPVSGEFKHTLIFSDGSTATVDDLINTGSDGCGTGHTVTVTNKDGSVKTRTFNF